MARLIDLFTFSGKMGDLVGCSGPSGHYVRSKPRTSTKQPTAKQLEARARFALVMDFFNPLREIIYLGFATKGDRGYKTGALARALSHASRRAVEGTYPDLYLNPGEIRLSRGDLFPLAGITALLSGAGMLQVTWQGDADRKSAFGDDRVFVVVYAPGTKIMLLGEDLRSSESVSVDVSAEPPGTKLLVYACAAERDLSRFSDSQFLGRMVR